MTCRSCAERRAAFKAIGRAFVLGVLHGWASHSAKGALSDRIKVTKSGYVYISAENASLPALTKLAMDTPPHAHTAVRDKTRTVDCPMTTPNAPDIAKLRRLHAVTPERFYVNDPEGFGRVMDFYRAMMEHTPALLDMAEENARLKEALAEANSLNTEYLHTPVAYYIGAAEKAEAQLYAICQRINCAMPVPSVELVRLIAEGDKPSDGLAQKIALELLRMRRAVESIKDGTHKKAPHPYSDDSSKASSASESDADYVERMARDTAFVESTDQWLVRFLDSKHERLVSLARSSTAVHESVSDEAVEAAYKALGRELFDDRRDAIRASLTAALPFMRRAPIHSSSMAQAIAVVEALDRSWAARGRWPSSSVLAVLAIIRALHEAETSHEAGTAKEAGR